MQIDEKEIFRNDRPPKGAVNIYMTKSVFEDFKKKCAKRKTAPSRVIERLIVAFLKSAA